MDEPTVAQSSTVFNPADEMTLDMSMQTPNQSMVLVPKTKMPSENNKLDNEQRWLPKSTIRLGQQNPEDVSI